MRIEETFVIAQRPQVVFDFVTDPANLSSWQTSIVSTADGTQVQRVSSRG